jgi:hypothetical protein
MLPIRSNTKQDTPCPPPQMIVMDKDKFKDQSDDKDLNELNKEEIDKVKAELKVLKDYIHNRKRDRKKN